MVGQGMHNQVAHIVQDILLRQHILEGVCLVHADFLDFGREILCLFIMEPYPA